MNERNGTEIDTRVKLALIENKAALALSDITGELVREHELTVDKLSQAMVDVAFARRRVEDFADGMSLREAEIVIAGTEGKNEAERRAALRLALEDDDNYQTDYEGWREARLALADCERRATIAKETARRLVAVLNLLARGV